MDQEMERTALAAEDVAKITEIVLAETDYTTDQIKVLEAN